MLLLFLFSVDIFLFSPFLSHPFLPSIVFSSCYYLIQQVGRIVSEKCKGTKNIYSRPAKLLVWQQRKEGGREEKGREERKEMEEKGRKASQESRVLPPFFFLFPNSYLQLVLEILSDYHLSLLVSYPSHSSSLPQPQILYTLQSLSFFSLQRGFTPGPPWRSCSHLFLSCPGPYIRPRGYPLMTCR